ncbi:2-succinyl-5-enolpyruvyl-6-hydroxy-3-cyclohexene-1-carboxylic-acid synthase, partial [bacterium]|nr:2-succinyl-5-enolpyruvyl-6-hydroxy-3-cyclohexene-1-carboxylic-acid synthase [bacterium]
MTQEDFNPNELWGSLIIEELVRNGIDYFCISPGSRSTPLVTAVARNKKTKKIICFDERGSAFHALGYAQATGKPAVVITTSGTAVANLLPAVVEAYQNKMPMILLTADRPPELLDVGANQTINQINIFGMYAKWHFCFPCPDKNITPKMVLATIDYAVYSSLNQPSGPVHINCMFREPLESDGIINIDKESIYLKDIRKWFENDKPYTSYSISKTIAGKTDTELVAEIINKEEKGLVSVGKLNNENEIEAVLNFVKKINWPVYADITSGLRFNNYVDSNIIKHFDQTIMSRDLNMKASPGTVIHFGGKITSKRFDRFLNQNKPENYIVVKNNPVRYDPVHIVTMHVETDISCFCENMSCLIKAKHENYFKNFYKYKAKKLQDIIDSNIENEENINEVFVSRRISNLLPDKSCLFLSNSMPI